MRGACLWAWRADSRRSRPCGSGEGARLTEPARHHPWRRRYCPPGARVFWPAPLRWTGFSVAHGLGLARPGRDALAQRRHQARARPCTGLLRAERGAPVGRPADATRTTVPSCDPHGKMRRMSASIACSAPPGSVGRSIPSASALLATPSSCAGQGLQLVVAEDLAAHGRVPGVGRGDGWRRCGAECLCPALPQPRARPSHAHGAGDTRPGSAVLDAFARHTAGERVGVRASAAAR